MKLNCCLRRTWLLLLSIFCLMPAKSQIALWVGQSYRADFTNSVIGITYNLNWSTNGGYLDLSGSGFYRDIRPTQYFSGTATVTCEWDYKLTASSSMQHVRRSVNITCRDNQVYISPATLTISPGQTAYVSSRHQYDNEYTSYANAYFQSTNPNVVSVNEHTGEVTANAPGEAYINVYSNISSTSPYCKVTVKKIDPTSVSLPSTMTLTVGENGKLTPTLYPTGAQTTYSWKSSNPDIATVNNGTVQALHHGTTTITVTTANGLSASCNLVVNKSQLKLSKSLESGLYSRGTTLTLTSQEGATIRYTTDGTKPNKNSTLYTSPLELENNINLRAIATHPDYLDSEEISARYEVTSLKVISRIPEQDGSTISTLNFPSVTYNKELSNNLDDSKIQVLHNEESIPHTTAVIGNTLYIIPEESHDGQEYQVIIAPYAIKSADDEPCTYEKLNVRFTDAHILFGEYPTDIFASSNLRFHLTNKNVLYNHNYWPTGNEPNSFTKYEPLPCDVTTCIVSSDSSNLVGFIKNDGWLWLAGYDGTFFKSGSKEPVKYKKVKTAAYSGNHGVVGWGTLLYTDENDVLYGIGNDCSGQLTGKGKQFYKNPDSIYYYYSDTPIKILEDVAKVFAYCGYCAALKNDGSLWVWGGNSLTVHTSSTPKKIASNVIFANLDYGDLMYITDDNSAYRYNYSQKTNTYVRNDVEFITGSFNDHGFFLTADHKLYGWGRNDYGQLGLGNTSSVNYSPSNPVFIKEGVTKVAHTYRYTLALTDNNEIYGWGSNYFNTLVPNQDSAPITTPTLLFKPEAQPELTDVEVPTEVKVHKGNPYPLPRLTIPADGVCQAADWSISDSEVAQIDNRGILSPLKEGSCTATLTLTKFDGSTLVRHSKVTVLPELVNSVENISMDESESVTYYNLQGMPVYTGYRSHKPDLPSGVYIVRQGSHAMKILVP